MLDYFFFSNHTATTNILDSFSIEKLIIRTIKLVSV